MEREAIAAVLNNAATIIDERGWCREVYMNGQGQVCMMGAIHLAITPTIRLGKCLGSFSREHEQAVGDVALTLNRHIGFTTCVPEWNDAVCSSKEQAVMKLREVAEKVAAGVAPEPGPHQLRGTNPFGSILDEFYAMHLASKELIGTIEDFNTAWQAANPVVVKPVAAPLDFLKPVKFSAVATFKNVALPDAWLHDDDPFTAVPKEAVRVAEAVT